MNYDQTDVHSDVQLYSCLQGTDESIEADAVADARPCGPRNQTQHAGSATTRGYGRVKALAALRKLLELCDCIRSCAAASRRRAPCAKHGGAAATCSLCWPCRPHPCRHKPEW